MNIDLTGEPFRAETISNMRVTQPLIGSIRIEWFDGAGARRSATRRGRQAQQLQLDLAAVASMGEPAFRCYLTGLVRGLTDTGGIDADGNAASG
jgi:uncharacterized protein YodC (DUF2158 family)